MSEPNSNTGLPSRADLERRQAAMLGELLAEVLPRNPFWQGKFAAAGLKAADFNSIGDLHRLPFVTKTEILADQAAHPPYGTNLTYPLPAYSRLHQTSGTTGTPLRWLDTPQSWSWILNCWEQLFGLMGLQRDDRLFFPFSFGPFLGFWAGFEGGQRLGIFCVAAGGMSSQARLQLLLDNQITTVCCTPTYALRLAEVAAEMRIDLSASPVRAILVAGEPGGNIPATRRRIESAWGAQVVDHWGMTELGPLAIESLDEPGGLYILETECIAEIIDPQTGEVVPQGVEGELVITNLGRIGSPLIRYRTGDRVRAGKASQTPPNPPLRRGGNPGSPHATSGDPSAPPRLAGAGDPRGTGSIGPGARAGDRTAAASAFPPFITGGQGGSAGEMTSQPAEIRHALLFLEGGILGRTDEMITVRGNNLYPSALEDVIRRFDAVAEYRIELRDVKAMQHLKIEIEPVSSLDTSAIAKLVLQIAETIKGRWHFQAEVVAVAPGSLPRFEMKGRRFVRS